MSPRTHKGTVRRRLLIGLGAVLAVAILVALAGWVYLLTLPGVGDAEARVVRILATHGATALALPPPRRLGEAVVAVEDEHFYANVAVNVLDGAGRAALAAVGSSEDPGGSTIQQQLAKRLYPHGGGVFGTLEEIGLGVKLSLHYSPAAILGMYLNAVYYGHGYWGEGAAARGYFGRSPRRLSWAQASLLAGLPQAPSAYDPLRHLGEARLRQRHVLDQLVVNGFLSRAGAARVYRQPLGLSGRPRPASSDPSRQSAANPHRVPLTPPRLPADPALASRRTADGDGPKTALCEWFSAHRPIGGSNGGGLRIGRLGLSLRE